MSPCTQPWFSFLFLMKVKIQYKIMIVILNSCFVQCGVSNKWLIPLALFSEGAEFISSFKGNVLTVFMSPFFNSCLSFQWKVISKPQASHSWQGRLQGIHSQMGGAQGLTPTK
jgi:hypothetical protein